MGGRNLLFIAIAVGLGLIAVVLANSYFSGVEQRQERMAQENELARIVVATQPLQFGVPLSPENIRMQNFPASSVPVGAFFSIEDLLQQGRVAIRPIVPGEPVLADKVSGRAVLSANLPEGMRAISIPISSTTAVSGFVRPADVVDVMLTRQLPGDEFLTNEVILENVQVLAIDQNASENATDPSVGSTATVLVDLFDAQKLTLAQRLGELSLALRNVEYPDPGPGVAVTPRDVGVGGVYRAPRTVVRASYSPPPAGPRAAAPMATGPVAPRGPAMTVIRGTDSTSYNVDRMGGK